MEKKILMKQILNNCAMQGENLQDEWLWLKVPETNLLQGD